MVGEHTLLIRNKYCKYKITVKRNITVITGDSGIGKTSIWNMINDYVMSNGKTNVQLISDCNVVPFQGTFEDFISKHSKVNNSIFILDEDCHFMLSDEFANVVKTSTNYFILITRVPLVNLPYSVKSVLTLVTENKNGMLETHTEDLFTGVYDKGDCSYLITEDSNSGRDFWENMFLMPIVEDDNRTNGKSTVYTKIYNVIENNGSCLVIVDGAAFGSEIIKVLNLIKSYSKQIILWLPESFEWLLLKSGIVWEKGIDKILENPGMYIASEKFMSWERFFTWVVTSIMSDTNHPYNKSSLSYWYVSPQNIEKMKAIMPSIIKESTLMK